MKCDTCSVRLSLTSLTIRSSIFEMTLAHVFINLRDAHTTVLTWLTKASAEIYMQAYNNEC